MSWLKEAFEWVQERVEKAQKAQCYQTHGERSFRQTIVWPDGSREQFWKLREPKTQNVRTMASFIAALKLASDFATVEESGGTVVYVSLGKITARVTEMLENTSDPRDDKVVFVFDVHPLVTLAAKIGGGVLMGHADLRQMLASGFGEVAFTPHNLLDIVKTVQFSALSESESEQSRDLDKLGKRITSKVIGTEALPDRIVATFNPSVFFLNLTPRSIEFTLTPIPSEQKFRLGPVAGSLNRAISEADEELVKHVISEISGAGLKPAAVLAGFRE